MRARLAGAGPPCPLQLGAALPRIHPSVNVPAFGCRQPSAGLEVEAPKERAHFNTRRFAAQHQLGHPVALQYFTAKPE